jgi:hypothetical protein
MPASMTGWLIFRRSVTLVRSCSAVMVVSGCQVIWIRIRQRAARRGELTRRCHCDGEMSRAKTRDVDDARKGEVVARNTAASRSKCGEESKPREVRDYIWGRMGCHLSRGISSTAGRRMQGVAVRKNGPLIPARPSQQRPNLFHQCGEILDCPTLELGPWPLVPWGKCSFPALATASLAPAEICRWSLPPPCDSNLATCFGKPSSRLHVFRSIRS